MSLRYTQSHHSLTAFPHSHSELGLEPLAEVVFQPPSLWPEGISFSPMPLLYPVQHHELSNKLTQGTAKTQTPRTEITISIQPAGLKRSQTAADPNQRIPSGLSINFSDMYFPLSMYITRDEQARRQGWHLVGIRRPSGPWTASSDLVPPCHGSNCCTIL